MTSRVQRCPLLGVKTVRFVFKTTARLRIMHANEPVIPRVAASMNLTWMSQYTRPCHQLIRSSVGQIIAFTKLKTFDKIIQKRRLVAARLRFLICQAMGGISRQIDMNASTGTATAPGVRLKFGVSIVIDARMLVSM